MSISRVQSATEADWDFVIEDGDLHRACILAAKRAAREFEAVEFDDAYQDAVLFLAVRPELQATARSGHYTTERLGLKLYNDALRPGAVGESERGKVTVSREALIALELGGAS